MMVGMSGLFGSGGGTGAHFGMIHNLSMLMIEG